MSRYSLSHLSDGLLERRVERIIAHDSRTTAWVLAHIAEYDARKLYVPKGYPSMFSYCVQHLHLSEDAAYKRIRAARAAREHPAIFEMIAAGRLHLCGVTELAPYLRPENAVDCWRPPPTGASSRSGYCWRSASRGRTCRPGWRKCATPPARANWRRRQFVRPNP